MADAVKRVAAPAKKAPAKKAAVAAKTPRKATAKKSVPALTAAKAPAKRRAPTKQPAATGASWQADKRIQHLVDLLGNKTVARLLGVSESQPSRWRSGAETPGPAVAPALIDLDHVVARLGLLWDASVIPAWLTGTNGHLDGARPIDVLRTHGSGPVLEAVQAEASGAYA